MVSERLIDGGPAPRARSNSFLPGGKKKAIIYIAGGGVALAVSLWAWRRSKLQSAGISDDGVTDDSGYSDADYGDSGYTPATGGATGLSSSYDTGSVSVPTTNAEWSQRATLQLQALGYDAMAVADALGRYLAGGTLTADQFRIVQSAIGQAGYPPVPVPAPKQEPPAGQNTKPTQEPKPEPKPTPKPEPKPTPKPAPKPKYKVYVVRRGDSLSSIASQFNVKGGWQTLWNSTPAIHKNGSPSLIYAGQHINIPV